VDYKESGGLVSRFGHFYCMSLNTFEPYTPHTIVAIDQIFSHHCRKRRLPIDTSSDTESGGNTALKCILGAISASCCCCSRRSLLSLANPTRALFSMNEIPATIAWQSVPMAFRLEPAAYTMK